MEIELARYTFSLGTFKIQVVYGMKLRLHCKYKWNIIYFFLTTQNSCIDGDKWTYEPVIEERSESHQEEYW